MENAKNVRNTLVKLRTLWIPMREEYVKIFEIKRNLNLIMLKEAGF